MLNLIVSPTLQLFKDTVDYYEVDLYSDFYRKKVNPLFQMGNYTSYFDFLQYN